MRQERTQTLATRTGTRRHLLGVGGSLAAVATIGRSAFAQTPEGSPSATPAAGWTFIDDKGVTVTLPEAPQRIVADVNAAAPLWDMGIRPVAIFGWNANESGDFGAAGGRIDASAVTIVGSATEPINVEKLVAAQPDLIVTLTWSPEEPEDYWSIDPQVLDQVKEVAPIVALSAVERADIAVERFLDLAVAIDPSVAGSQQNTGDKAAYEKAAARLTELAAAKPEISFTFLWAGPEVLYIAVPANWGDLALFQHLGLPIVTPEEPQLPQWAELSWEQALQYRSDVVMNSWRSEIANDDLKNQPTLAPHPAIEAGQIGSWNQDFIISHRGLIDAIQAVIDALEPAGNVYDEE